MVDVDPFPYLGAAGCQQNAGAQGCYKRPMDLDFGPDGSLYVIEWGSGFGGNNLDSGIYRIDYTAGDRRPVAHATRHARQRARRRSTSSSRARARTTRRARALSFAWDFDNNGTTDSTEANPAHTYTNPGSYTATLRVTDAGGLTAVDNVQVVAGNTRPVVTIEIPENGQFAAFGDKVPYKISVTDAQDGSTGSGISCSDVTLNVSLGHDLHAHTLSTHTGCEGTVDTLLTSGHGDTANVFTVLEAIYTDKGATGSVPLTGRAEAILPPKRKQAEFYSSTGRAANGTGGGDPGVQIEDTTDAGAGKNIGFIEDGDYVSFNPVSLKDIRALTFRVASGGAGGRHRGAPRLADRHARRERGGRQHRRLADVDERDAAARRARPPGRTSCSSCSATRRTTAACSTSTGSRPSARAPRRPRRRRSSADATPKTGAAPLEVHFTGTATDDDAEPGDTLTYKWDFGVAGHHRRHLDREGPDLHVRAGGHLQRDVHGHRRAGRALVRHGAGRGHRRRLRARRTCGRTSSTATRWTPTAGT